MEILAAHALKMFAAMAMPAKQHAVELYKILGQ
jgi:hypothetical protein